MAGQITGAEAVYQALLSGQQIDRVLVDREKDTTAIRELCEQQNIPLEEGSTNDLWRMSAEGHVDALALTGRFQTKSIDEFLKRLDAEIESSLKISTFFLFLNFETTS